MWAIAGILDSLRDNCPEEARARACLALAAFDQQSIDSGAWVYAQEIMFEPSPPLSAFQSRRVVVSDPLESYHSKLLDPRVADVLLHRVKELESYLEAKKKLGRSKQSDPPGGRNDEDDSGKRWPRPRERREEQPPRGGSEVTVFRVSVAGRPASWHDPSWCQCLHLLCKLLLEFTSRLPGTRQGSALLPRSEANRETL